MVAKCSTDPQSKITIVPIPPAPPRCDVKPGAIVAICGADEPAPKPVSHKSQSETPKIKKTSVAAAPPRINSVSVKASELPEELSAILELQVPKKESPDGSAGFGERFAQATQQARDYQPAWENHEAQTPDVRRFAGVGSYTKKLRATGVAGNLPTFSTSERGGIFRTPSPVGKQGTFTYGRVLDMRNSKDREELIRLQKGAHSPEQKMTPIRLTFYNEGDVTTETIPLASISKEHLYGIW